MAKKKSSSRSALGRNPLHEKKAQKKPKSARVAPLARVARSASDSRQRITRAREVLHLFLEWLSELFAELKRWASVPLSALARA